MPFIIGIGADPERLMFCGIPELPPWRAMAKDISGGIWPWETERIGGPGSA